MSKPISRSVSVPRPLRKPSQAVIVAPRARGGDDQRAAHDRAGGGLQVVGALGQLDALDAGALAPADRGDVERRRGQRGRIDPQRVCRAALARLRHARPERERDQRCHAHPSCSRAGHVSSPPRRSRPAATRSALARGRPGDVGQPRLRVLVFDARGLAGRRRDDAVAARSAEPREALAGHGVRGPACAAQPLSTGGREPVAARLRGLDGDAGHAPVLDAGEPAVGLDRPPWNDCTATGRQADCDGHATATAAGRRMRGVDMPRSYGRGVRDPLRRWTSPPACSPRRDLVAAAIAVLRARPPGRPPARGRAVRRRDGTGTPG